MNRAGKVFLFLFGSIFCGCLNFEALHQSCDSDSDCISKVCGPDRSCQSPRCDDEVYNGDESDVDCGQQCADEERLCAILQHCRTNLDCASSHCTRGYCVEAHCLNGTQKPAESNDQGDLLESGRDCGGTECAPCLHGWECKLDRDCADGCCATPFNPTRFCVAIGEDCLDRTTCQHGLFLGCQ